MIDYHIKKNLIIYGIFGKYASSF